MALSALDDKSQVPSDDSLSAVLGPAEALWKKLVSALAADYQPLTETWSYSGKQWGWSLALKNKKRTIVYLTPSRSFFHAGFALGEKAVSIARSGGGLTPEVLSIIDSARKYAEGRAVRLEVRTAEDVRQVLVIAAAKMAKE
jgi:asparagine synthetase A